MKCNTKPKLLGGLWQEKNRINLEPPYQREGGVWSVEKQQLFIDSLINSFDVPKLYFHDISAKNEPFLWAVIDGKQRLQAIWEFFADKFPLADDFTFLGDVRSISDGKAPEKSQFYSQFSDGLKEYFKSKTVDVVDVIADDEDEIEDLFSRLNNGEPLNAAEKRNAKPGQMVKLIREVAGHSFFRAKLGFPNRRGSHLEVAAKFIRLELTYRDSKNFYSDLKKKHLDSMVVTYRDMSNSDYQGVLARVNAQLTRLEKLFRDKDLLLQKQSYPQLYYAWVREVESTYAIDRVNETLLAFLDKFMEMRIANNLKPEDQRDSRLVDYGRLSMQGTNDMNSMKDRGQTLTRYLLEYGGEIAVRDTKRAFTDDERYLIWKMHGMRCMTCGKELPDLSDMDADHVKAWSKGGKTTLQNAQCLCTNCNQKKGSA